MLLNRTGNGKSAYVARNVAQSVTERLRFTVLFALLVGVAAASVWPAWGIAAVALTFVATVLAISVAAAVRYGRRWEWTQHSTVRRS